MTTKTVQQRPPDRAFQIDPKTGAHIRIVDVLRVEDGTACVRGVYGRFAGVEYDVPEAAIKPFAGDDAPKGAI